MGPRAKVHKPTGTTGIHPSLSKDGGIGPGRRIIGSIIAGTNPRMGMGPRPTSGPPPYIRIRYGGAQLPPPVTGLCP